MVEINHLEQILKVKCNAGIFFLKPKKRLLLVQVQRQTILSKAPTFLGMNLPHGVCHLEHHYSSLV
jgi:hypothetical protein